MLGYVERNHIPEKAGEKDDDLRSGTMEDFTAAMRARQRPNL